ncbi:MAG TPA: DUF3224 domain-containing protein [Candidatus Acidoferrum sp.]|nr:DUF3224 domain-containing protein [Candidatus Acidoferrum sp.]
MPPKPLSPSSPRDSREATRGISLLLLAFLVPLAVSSTARIHPNFQKGVSESTHATGTFELKIVSQPPNDIESAASIGRFTIDKELHGDLEATSKGEMLTSGDPKSSAAYVAIERVNGTLHGRSGSFVLQHTAYMTPTSQQMLISVAPESGSGQLIGLSGKFIIKIENKKHFYDFEYSLPAEN